MLTERPALLALQRLSRENLILDKLEAVFCCWVVSAVNKRKDLPRLHKDVDISLRFILFKTFNGDLTIQMF